MPHPHQLVQFQPTQLHRQHNMHTEKYLETILYHLEDLQNTVQSLQNSASDLNISYTPNTLSPTNVEVDHEDIKNSVNDLSNILTDKMAKTEQLAKSALHPDRIDQLTNFFKVMQDTMDSMEK